MYAPCNAVTNAVSNAVCNAAPDPTRPDPTRNYYSGHLGHHDVAYVTRAAVDAMMSEANR